MTARRARGRASGCVARSRLAPDRIDAEDQRATVTQDASGLDQHLLGLLDMAEAVARQHHVNARGTERDLFGPDREIDSGRVRQQEIVRRVLLRERLDTDADPGRARVGDPSGPGPMSATTCRRRSDCPRSPPPAAREAPRLVLAATVYRGSRKPVARRPATPTHRRERSRLRAARDPTSPATSAAPTVA